MDEIKKLLDDILNHVYNTSIRIVNANNEYEVYITIHSTKNTTGDEEINISKIISSLERLNVYKLKYIGSFIDRFGLLNYLKNYGKNINNKYAYFNLISNYVDKKHETKSEDENEAISFDEQNVDSVYLEDIPDELFDDMPENGIPGISISINPLNGRRNVWISNILAGAGASFIAYNLFFEKIKPYIGKIIAYLMKTKAVKAIGSLLNMIALRLTKHVPLLAYNGMIGRIVNDSQLLLGTENGQSFIFEFISPQNGTCQIVTNASEICVNLINNTMAICSPNGTLPNQAITILSNINGTISTTLGDTSLLSGLGISDLITTNIGSTFASDSIRILNKFNVSDSARNILYTIPENVCSISTNHGIMSILQNVNGTDLVNIFNAGTDKLMITPQSSLRLISQYLSDEKPLNFVSDLMKNQQSLVQNLISNQSVSQITGTVIQGYVANTVIQALPALQAPLSLPALQTPIYNAFVSITSVNLAGLAPSIASTGIEVALTNTTIDITGAVVPIVVTAENTTLTQILSSVLSSVNYSTLAPVMSITLAYLLYKNKGSIASGVSFIGTKIKYLASYGYQTVINSYKSNKEKTADELYNEIKTLLPKSYYDDIKIDTDNNCKLGNYADNDKKYVSGIKNNDINKLNIGSLDKCYCIFDMKKMRSNKKMLFKSGDFDKIVEINLDLAEKQKNDKSVNKQYLDSMVIIYNYYKDALALASDQVNNHNDFIEKFNNFIETFANQVHNVTTYSDENVKSLLYLNCHILQKMTTYVLRTPISLDTNPIYLKMLKIHSKITDRIKYLINISGLKIHVKPYKEQRVYGEYLNLVVESFKRTKLSSSKSKDVAAIKLELIRPDFYEAFSNFVNYYIDDDDSNYTRYFNIVRDKTQIDHIKSSLDSKYGVNSSFWKPIRYLGNIFKGATRNKQLLYAGGNPTFADFLSENSLLICIVIILLLFYLFVYKNYEEKKCEQINDSLLFENFNQNSKNQCQ